MDVATLRSVPLFASLDQKSAVKLSEFLSIQDYARAQAVFRNHDPGDAMYLIDMGRVRIGITDADGHHVTLAELGPGDFFGEMSMLDGHGRSADATVMQIEDVAQRAWDVFHAWEGVTPSKWREAERVKHDA